MVVEVSRREAPGGVSGIDSIVEASPLHFGGSSAAAGGSAGGGPA